MSNLGVRLRFVSVMLPVLVGATLLLSACSDSGSGDQDDDIYYDDGGGAEEPAPEM
ncbi:MAG: hypothetical protein KJ626_09025 [Verrucomicrobia bacterium]|nr:hypothetical protein [Verrucomicrobiota bacterium]